MMRWTKRKNTGEPAPGTASRFVRRLLSAGTGAALLCLSGCAATELENKSFPLAVLAGEQEGQCRVCYLSQDLSQVANENADGQNVTSASALGSTYYEAQKTFEKNNRCQLDLSHTKVLIFQQSFFESDNFHLFLETVRQENMYARNTLVFLSDATMKELSEMNGELEMPLGSYLEQMMENEQDIRGQAVVTLGTLLNEQANSSQTILIPKLVEENGLPVIHAYQVMQDFVQKGEVDVEQAMVCYLLENQLQQMDLRLAEGIQVRLRDLRCKRDYTLRADTDLAGAGQKAVRPEITGRLTVTATARRITGKESEEEITQMLQDKIEDVCRSVWREQQADLSDSFRYLARYAPDIYRVYKERPEAFRELLDYQVQVEIHLV